MSPSGWFEREHRERLAALFDGHVDRGEFPFRGFDHHLERRVLPDELARLTDGDRRAGRTSGPEPGNAADDEGEDNEEDDESHECAHARIIARS